MAVLKRNNVPGKPSSDRRREGPAENSGGIQVHSRRRLWSGLLRHELQRPVGAGFSHVGVEEIRGQVGGGALDDQVQAQAPRPDELLGTSREGGWAGQNSDSLFAP